MEEMWNVKSEMESPAIIIEKYILGCSPPGDQSDLKKSLMHIPPSHDPNKWILKGIMIWSTGRPPPRNVVYEPL